MRRPTLLLATGALACASPPAAPTDTAGARDRAQARALFIGIDGVRPDAFEAAAPSHLDVFPTVLTWLGADPALLANAAGLARVGAPALHP